MTNPKAPRKNRVRVQGDSVRAALKELLDRAEFHGERIVITRYNKDSAALVSIADLEKIETA
jgi:prevent-host-death family protein